MFGAVALAGSTAVAETPVPAGPEGKERHVVLMVWDGMRPDYITADNSPNLFKLAESGTFFTHHHSVYITSTEVNGTALATGCYPNHSGVMANLEYRPDMHLLHAFNTESLSFMRIADALSDGKYLMMPTMAEILQAAGQPTVIAGAKPVVCLQDRNLNRTSEAARQSVLLYAGATQPQAKLKEIEETIGPYPGPPQIAFVPNDPQNNWTVSALTDVLWKNGVPKLTVLWMADPDFSQHQLGPGSFAALPAIKSNDENLGKVLAALEKKGVRDKTDIFIVSDHGFSTVEQTLDLATLLKTAGFKVTRYFLEAPHPGETLIVALGGSTLLYVTGHDPAVIQKLVDFLQQSPFSGPIFTKDALPGTFALKDARIDTAWAPDIVFSYRWSEEKSRFGSPGLLISEGVKGKLPGFGTHASTSRFDFHNTLVGAGPDIRAGYKDEFPSANVDVAPTILHLLGIAPPQPMDGRVLKEALAAETFAPPAVTTQFLHAKREIEDKKWEQYLKYTVFGDWRYLDEGSVGSGE